MRTRKIIEERATETRDLWKGDLPEGAMLHLMLEVLLDIRDLLKPVIVREIGVDNEAGQDKRIG